MKCKTVADWSDWLKAATISLMLSTAAPALAQNSTVYLQNSGVYGIGGTVSVIRVPIQKPDGTFLFKDLTLALTADANGVIKSGKITQALSPMLNTANIIAGKYVYNAGSSDVLKLSGPGPLDDSNEAKWSLITVYGVACGVPATFYTGQLSQNPLYPRLQAAGINSPEYSYGIATAGSGCSEENNIIGVAQDGNQIEIADFTTSKGNDQSTPVSRAIYVLTQ